MSLRNSSVGDGSEAALRCEPLHARINPLLEGRHQKSSTACAIACAKTASAWTLDPPFFTRLIAEGGLSVSLKQSYAAELRSRGIAWLGDSLAATEEASNESRSESPYGNRIASIEIDEPIDVGSLRTAAAIELQLFGVPFQTLPNSRRARWSPGLPVELSAFEQLGRKVELLRSLTGGILPIGAAISPGSVYEDVRYMVDSGFDFVTLLCQVQYGIAPSSCLSLAHLDHALERSAKAIHDSGARTKLMIAANLLDGQRMFRCLQLGASAVCIDAFVAHSRPMDAAPVRDTFGSVLSAYKPAATNPSFAWLQPAMSQLLEELWDCATYAGEPGR